PRPPIPQTPTYSPARRAARSTSAAYGVDTASQAMAACSNDTPSGTAASATNGTTTFVAHPPAYLNPMIWGFQHSSEAPDAHRGQAVHAFPATIHTRAPAFQDGTWGPARSISP